MRILGFAKRWDKLSQPEFTTFRFPRRDKDWAIGERVQIVYKPRRKGGGEKLGIAEIIFKEARTMAWRGDKTGYQKVTNEEAIADGFENKGNKEAYFSMWEFLFAAYAGWRLANKPMNKLTLRWVR